MTIPTPTRVAVRDATDPYLYLPPQTTPFSYIAPGDPCHQSVYCPWVTQAIYTYLTASSSHPMQSQACFAVHTILWTGAPRPGYESHCFPEGYFNLFPSQTDQLNIYATPGNEGGHSTLAYPGTDCPWLWTAACTTTITHQDSLFPQLWCCPPGGWTCATAIGPSDKAAPQRLCKSLMTEATEVWMSWDPPAFSESTNTAVERYTWPAPIVAEAPENAANVFHMVLPLSMTQGIAARGDALATVAKSIPASTTASQSNVLHIIGTQPTWCSISVLPSGTVAEIVVAAVLLVMGLLVGVIVLYRRRFKDGNLYKNATSVNNVVS
ncbi:hypothetical protein BJ170DRAFT_178748 [Xylariales sp. AK1849]|nr:hypothetical protein BJ170DRAFT_178748 [Xylariales sp. AK1849]